ncbi:MAG: dTDP-4-dehydrorhamnose reductase [Terricaulis sp.]
MRVLVIGKSGQLAQALAPHTGVTCVGRGELDFSRAGEADIVALLAASRCDVAINAAAYTAVDQAESDAAGAFALNQTAPRHLAAACARANTPLVHVSTDYVFDGAKHTPYTESDPVTPLNVYGASKAAGENEIFRSGARATVIRTSWVYGARGSNFLNTMRRLAETRPEVGVVHDQHGAPTWAADLASACYVAAERLVQGDDAATGLFHFAGGGEATWATFAEAIFEQARLRGLPSAKVKRIPAAEFQTVAKRPKNSRLDTSHFARIFAPPRPWIEALSLCMDEVAALRTA